MALGIYSVFQKEKKALTYEPIHQQQKKLFILILPFEAVLLISRHSLT